MNLSRFKPCEAPGRHIRIKLKYERVNCEDCTGTGLPRMKTEVIYVDWDYLTVLGSIHPKRNPAAGLIISVFRLVLQISAPLPSENGTQKQTHTPYGKNTIGSGILCGWYQIPGPRFGPGCQNRAGFGQKLLGIPIDRGTSRPFRRLMPRVLRCP